MQTNNTNERMAALHRKYGRIIRVDFFYPDTWRVWVQGWHIHQGLGMHGGWAGQGDSVDAAIDRLEAQARKSAPIQGDNCEKGCPHYSNDCY